MGCSGVCDGPAGSFPSSSPILGGCAKRNGAFSCFSCLAGWAQATSVPPGWRGRAQVPRDTWPKRGTEALSWPKWSWGEGWGPGPLSPSWQSSSCTLRTPTAGYLIKRGDGGGRAGPGPPQGLQPRLGSVSACAVPPEPFGGAPFGQRASRR